MNNNAALFALSLLICSSVAAEMFDEPPAELLELCKQVKCRVPEVKLLLVDSATFESKNKFALPVLQGDLVSIYPGENVFIEATVEGGQVKLERAVSSVERAERTIQFMFRQLPGKPDMQLEIKNPFQVGLRFRMGLMRPGSADIYRTSSCPLPAGLTGYEHWPFPIYQLVVTDAKVVGSSEPFVCR